MGLILHVTDWSFLLVMHVHMLCTDRENQPSLLSSLCFAYTLGVYTGSNGVSDELAVAAGCRFLVCMLSLGRTRLQDIGRQIGGVGCPQPPEDRLQAVGG